MSEYHEIIVPMARHLASDSAPPCALGKHHQDRCECLVARVDGAERAGVLSKLAQAMIVASCGPHMTAVVVDAVANVCFLVVLTKPSTTTVAVERLQTRIEQLPEGPKVVSIEPLNRRLQARLGWGDVHLNALTRPAIMDALDAEILRDGLPGTMYWEHPTEGRPFQVIDPPKPNDDEKLAWMRQELGSRSCGLIDFARKYLELFQSKVHAVTVQKTSVLRLYRRYSGSSWAMESDLLPALLTEFQQVCHPEAPERCRGCAKALVGRCPITHSFCSDACARAGKIIRCRRCKSAARLTVTDGLYHCGACWAVPGPKRGRDEFADRVDQLAKASRWGVSGAADPDHEPAWKRRRKA